MILMLALGTALAADPMVTQATVHTLDNGLVVVLEEDRRTDAVALHLHYGVGSRDELPSEIGCAHLFEHIMFEGSRNAPGNAFDEWLTAAGGTNNAFTSEDETAYHMVFPSGATELALFLESDRMGFLLDGLTQENLDNQRSIVIQERRQGYAEPHGRDWDAVTRLQFAPGHPYHHPVIGEISTVEAFTLEGAQEFWKRNYRPRNAVLGVVGNFETEEMLALVAHWFSDVPDAGPPVERAKTVSVPVQPKDGLLYDEVEDRTLYVSWATVPIGHPDEPALALLSWVLSGGRGTRLDDRLYYKSRLATEVAAYGFSAELDGQFLVYAATDKPSLATLERVVQKVIDGLGTDPPTEDELTRARRAFRSQLLDGMEYPEDRAEVLVDCQRLEGDPNCTDDEWKRYEAVTRWDLVRVARTYLVPERRVTLSVVPEGDSGHLPGAQPVELP